MIRAIILCCLMMLPQLCLAENKVVRMEGRYTATYSFKNENNCGEAVDSGRVVYYVKLEKDGIAMADCDVFSDTIVCKYENIAEKKAKQAFMMMSAIWPYPLKVEEASGVTETHHDMLKVSNKDAERVLNLTGNATEMQKWDVDDSYLPSGQLKSMTLTAQFVAKGKTYRMIFGVPATDCTSLVTVTIDRVAMMTPKEAKAARKADK